jgi:hypothetical protein
VSAAAYDLNIEAGATFKVVLNVKDGPTAASPALDLTGWVPRLQVRKDAAALGVLLDCNTTNGRITVTGVGLGEITLALSATDTARLDAGGGVYDLIITKTATGEVRRLLKGSVIVSPSVTR